MRNVLINLLDLCRHGTHTLGPGLRYVLWLQGCPFACKGCITPEGRGVDANKLVEVDSLIEDIVQNQRISGLTISGGEPFLQYDSLLYLLERLKALRPDIDVLVFTGYTIEALNWPQAKEILKYVDVLIDGPYIEERNDGIGLRGSDNQRIHFLTERLEPYRDEMEKGVRKVEMEVDSSYVRIIGIPIND